MVKHIVAWKYAENFTEREKIANGERIKQELEALNGKVDGLISLTVYNTPLKTGDYDIALVSELKDEDALFKYQENPEHKKAAGFIKSVAKTRVCLDFSV